jgi:hypothetical protein
MVFQNITGRENRNYFGKIITYCEGLPGTHAFISSGAIHPIGTHQQN